MSIKITISSGGRTVKMDVDSSTTINDILERSMKYWGKRRGAYNLLRDNTLLPGQSSVSGLGITEGDTLELVPSPEGG